MNDALTVNFGHETGVAHDFVNLLIELGHLPSGAGGMVTFPGAAAGDLQARHQGTDGSIRDSDGQRYVWMRGYGYPLKPASSPQFLAVRKPMPC